MTRPVRLCIAGLALLLAGGAGAHAFAPPYTLPVPFSMYAMGAAASLVLSFVVAGSFASAPASLRAGHSAQAVDAVEPAASPAGQVVSVMLLALCILTGLLGTQNLHANFNMTFFWIVFVLAVPYLTAVIGDFYAPLNPWRAIVQAVERTTGRPFDGRLRAPERLGYAPALLLYGIFIWIELFAHLSPRGLSLALLAYTAINLAGAWLLGTARWFRCGEFFGVMLALIGRMAPRGRPWRAPLVGLLQEPRREISLAVFILFMLSSTAFDGLHGTQPWVSVFWKGLYPQIAPLLDGGGTNPYRLSTQIYYAWQWLMLALSPLAYLLVFGACVAAAKWSMRSPLPLRELVSTFALTLVPIAFVYHVTHYYTILLAQGGQILRLVSDPFGKGWNLLGTARWQIEPLLVDVNLIWHSQVALILLGHIASVWLAHLEAQRLFPGAGRALLSQLPMLGLMVSFTAFGLWILSLPLSVGA